MLSSFFFFFKPLIMAALVAQLVKNLHFNSGDLDLILGLGRSSGEGINYPLQYSWASLVAQMVKNLPAMQTPQSDSWVGKILWRRDRLPTSVFLGFPGGSAGKESACNAGEPGLIPRSGRRERLPTPAFWPGEFHGLYSPWGRKESEAPESLSLCFVFLLLS